MRIKKAIDNDIIKALEDWLKNFEGKAVDYMKIRFALDLINRQKAEIERLKESFNFDFDNFESEYDSKIKSEAIKEFAELVKRNHGALFNTIYSRRFGEIIDNLVKEMVGAESGS